MSKHQLSSIAGNANLAAAQATYSALFETLWADTGGMAFMNDSACRTVQISGSSLRIPVATSFPRFRVWNGSKQDKSIRAFAQTITVQPYERTIGLKRLEVDADTTGVVPDTLRAFLSDAKRGLDDILVAKYIANTWLGYDGTALMSDSHPYSNSTGDNLETAALSHEIARSVKAKMRLFTDEDGTPLNINPTTLYVGPSNERLGMEITQAGMRYVALNASGAEATSSVVAAAAAPNVYAGTMDLVVIPWLGAQYAFCDLSKPGLTPFIRAVFREVEAITTEGQGMADHDRFHKDKRYYSLEGDFEFAPGLWQLIDGRVAA